MSDSNSSSSPATISSSSSSSNASHNPSFGMETFRFGEGESSFGSFVKKFLSSSDKIDNVKNEPYVNSVPPPAANSEEAQIIPQQPLSSEVSSLFRNSSLSAPSFIHGMEPNPHGLITSHQSPLPLPLASLHPTTRTPSLVSFTPSAPPQINFSLVSSTSASSHGGLSPSVSASSISLSASSSASDLSVSSPLVSSPLGGSEGQLVPLSNGQHYVDITEYLNMPQKQAAKKLGIPTSTLSKRWKEACRTRKWPYRNVSKLDREITTLLHNLPQGQTSWPADVEETLGFLLRKRQDELRPVVIRI